MKALKNYAVMIVTYTMIMCICSSGYAKDNPPECDMSTIAVNGGDGNKKDGAPDKNQDNLPVKAGDTTPAGQIQATGQGGMQVLKHQVVELSCLSQKMQEIGSKQDELRTEVQGYVRAVKKGDGRGVVSLFVGAIAVILILMGIVGGVWYLNFQIAEQLGGIKASSSGASFGIEQIEEIKQAILTALPSSSGRSPEKFVNLTNNQITTIADKVYEKLGLSNELNKLAEQHFGSKAGRLEKSANKIEEFISSVGSFDQKAQEITSSAGSLSEKVGEAIRSLNEATTSFVMDVRTAKESFCNEEAVKVLPDVQKLIQELRGALTKANTELNEKVKKLEGESREAQSTIVEKDEKIRGLIDAIQMKGNELIAEKTAHNDDNTTNEGMIGQLNVTIKELQTKLGVAEAAKDAAQQSLGTEQKLRGAVEAEKGNLEKVIASRDVWNKSLFPSWFEDNALKSLHDALCSEFMDKAPSTECLLFRAVLLELKAMELKGTPDGIESLLTRLGRYCFAYLNEKCEARDVFDFGRIIANSVFESALVHPTGIYVRVPRMGGQVDLQWMKSLSNERTVQSIRTWSVWSERNGMFSKAEVN